MGAEKAPGDQRYAERDQRDVVGQRREHAGQADQRGGPDDAPPPVTPGEAAHHGRTHRPHDIEQENHAHRRLAERNRRQRKPEGQIIVGADEGADDQERLREQQPQPGIAEMADIDAQQRRRVEGLARARALARQRIDEIGRAGEADQRDRRQTGAPVPVVGENRADEPPRHPAQRVAGDIDAHDQSERLGRQDIGEIGHGDGGQAAEGKARQRAEDQQRGPVARQRHAKRGERGRDERKRHHPLAPDRLRQRARQQQRGRHHQRRDRQCEARRRRGQREVAREQRQQRLHAVEQREGREATEKKSCDGARERLVAAPDLAGRGTVEIGTGRFERRVHGRIEPSREWRGAGKRNRAPGRNFTPRLTARIQTRCATRIAPASRRRQRPGSAGRRRKIRRRPRDRRAARPRPIAPAR